MIRTFGKAIVGGRRHASQERLSVPAVLSRIEQRQLAILVDFSKTGARLKGSKLPPVGEPVSLLIDCVRAYGTVAWIDDDLCGVAFDAPLAQFEVDRLRRDATDATLSFGNIETKVWMEEGLSKLAR